MKYTTVAALFLASKAMAAPLQQRDYAVKIVDVTVTDYSTVTVQGYVPPVPVATSTVAAAAYVPHKNNGHHYHHHPQGQGGYVKTITYTLGPAPAPTDYSSPDNNDNGDDNSDNSTPVYNPPVYNPPPVSYSAPQPTQAPSTGSSNTGNSFADAIVQKHNEYRAKHGAGPLTWSDKLAQYAADNMPDCNMQHTANGIYGENLAKGYGSAADAVKAWYDEVGSYRGDYSSGTGHFSQVVWKATTQIGCHMKEECNYLKCEYSVPGNLLGSFAKNVQV